MRAVVINDSVDPSKIRMVDEWTALARVWSNGSVLLGPDDTQLYDQELFILDPARLGTNGAGTNVSVQINEMVNAGGCLITFADERVIACVPVEFSPRGGGGNDIDVVPDTVLAGVFDRYHSEMSYRTQLDRSKSWTPTATALNGFPVSGIASYGRGIVIVLPQFKRPHLVLRDLLESVVPPLAPLVSRRARRGKPSEDPPSWRETTHLQRADEIATELSDLRGRIDELQQEHAAKEREYQDIDRFRDLLWAKGQLWLEPLVQDALTILGVPCAPEPPKDLVHHFDENELWIEVEGTEGCIQVAKAGQLFNYLAAEPEKAATVVCAIIGNPYRLNSPDDRPPRDGQEGLFSGRLKDVAEKQGWALVTTQELLRFLNRKFNGDDTASTEIRTRLGLISTSSDKANKPLAAIRQSRKKH